MDTQDFFLLMDPSWNPDRGTPPAEAVVGLWPVEDGTVGKFRSNPQYVATDGNSPSDPLDAVLRLALRGRAEARHIQLMLRDSLFDLAMNGDGRPLVTTSPDDVPCVVVASGEPHGQRVSAPRWRRVDLGDLVVLLADGVDVLFNPGGPASVRLTGDFLRETMMLGDDLVAEGFPDNSAARARRRPAADNFSLMSLAHREKD
ncbi:type VII secretion system-associated protein [Kutzneria chonburiensis]|uniref:Type VII secretion system-associated protein n=1 Tax=Kutzneria chonburiensis TaxID=1483604 RepID=A0ABV6N5M8_9PSEU|nr:type VII secretion system-associated protein [Kutzneria chonburiensis]